MQILPVDNAALENRAALVKELRTILPDECVIVDEAALRVYETDALTAYRQLPMLVVLPETTAQVAAVLELCSRLNIKVVPRGAGTSLSGGALPLTDGIVLGLGKFNRILEVDFANRCVVAQSGVTNLAITDAVKHKGFLLRSGPIQPDRLYHRRERQRKFRRCALSQIWFDHEQRHGDRNGHHGRRDTASRGEISRSRPAMTCWALLPAPRDYSG